jgi:Ca2+-binding EF-hand superfamily protein
VAQVGSLKDAFTLFDANGKGWFGREELKEVMLALAGGSEPAAQELEQVFSELDCNDDGRVDFPEFMAKFMVCANIGDDAINMGRVGVMIRAWATPVVSGLDTNTFSLLVTCILPCPCSMLG